MSVFGNYAQFYDLFYKNKDYSAECDIIENILKAHSSIKVQTILDLGCGTGNHAFLLHQKGYKVVGVDKSEVMLANAERKLSKLSNKKNIRFEKGDIKNWKTDERFDAVLMMFAVLGYQLDNNDVLQTLTTVKKHLKPGGLFIFDVWYGPAVLSVRPSQRVNVFSANGEQILRIASGELDTLKHQCRVDYHIWHYKKQKIMQEVKETHTMRFFFPKELELFLQISGLELVKLGAFPQWKNSPSEETWNILGIARSV